MSKLLRLRDYLLLTAAFTGDVIDEMRLGWGAIPSAMKARYGYVPSKYKRASYSSTVSRMLSTGDIRKVADKKGQVYLELTSSGKKKFKRRFRLFTQSKKWDGLFMIVVFDIPEGNKSTRDSLRFKLKSLGFGMLQKSVWISPYHFEEDMREFLVSQGLEKSVFVLSARKLWAGDLKELGNNLWNLKDINESYKKIEREASIIAKLKGENRTRVLKRVFTLYLDTLSVDPLLPEEFLPDDWARDRALNVLNRVHKG